VRKLFFVVPGEGDNSENKMHASADEIKIGEGRKSNAPRVYIAYAMAPIPIRLNTIANGPSIENVHELLFASFVFESVVINLSFAVDSDLTRRQAKA
jgi:hypothetical protein